MRSALRVLCALAFALGSFRYVAELRAAESAASYPSRPIRFIAPTSPGGANDILPRILSAHMTSNWGQQVVVDLRPGAAGIVGSQIAATAAPDGYTLLIVSNFYTLNPSLYTKLPYDSMTNFERVTIFAVAPLVMVVHPSLPVKSIADMVSLLKAKPNSVNYGSSGLGTGGWLSAELFRRLAGVEMTHVPYKGAGQATAAVVAGEVQVLFTSSLPAMPHVRSGKLRALGVTSAKRMSVVENVPAIAEALPGYEVINYFGILVSGGTPRPVVDKLHAEIRRITALPSVKARFDDLGVEAVDYGPDEFTAFAKADAVKWTKILADAGIRPGTPQ